MDTYEASQPWVTYHYGLTHDGWWPFWNSTRFLGRARVRLACMVCGDERVVTIRLPRVGTVPLPKTGRHPERERYLAEHAHPDRGHPMSWAVPLRNLAAHPGGLDLDLFVTRLKSDLNGGGFRP